MHLCKVDFIFTTGGLEFHRYSISLKYCSLSTNNLGFSDFILDFKYVCGASTSCDPPTCKKWMADITKTSCYHRVSYSPCGVIVRNL